MWYLGGRQGGCGHRMTRELEPGPWCIFSPPLLRWVLSRTHALREWPDVETTGKCMCWTPGKPLYGLLRFWQAEISAHGKPFMDVPCLLKLPPANLEQAASSLSSSCPSFKGSLFSLIWGPLRVANRQTASSLKKVNRDPNTNLFLFIGNQSFFFF